MKKLIFFLLASTCLAQNTGQNVVTLPVVVNQTITTTTTFTSLALQNIGQTSHELIINVTGASSNYGVTASIQGSVSPSSNTTCSDWFDISAPIVPLNPTTISSSVVTSTVSGFKAYPCVRTVVKVNPGSNASLLVNATYVGTSSPSHNLIDALFADSNLLATTQSATGGVFTALTGGIAGYSDTLFAITLNIPSTVSLISVGCSTNGTTIDSGFQVLYLPNLGTTQTLNWPLGLRGYEQCNPGVAYYIASVGTGTIGISLWHRYE